MLRVITIALALVSTSVMAKGAYKCYGGKLSNAVADNISEVRIALAKEQKKASFIVFYEHESKYSIDIFCPHARIGRCSLENDAGSFQLLTLAGDKMMIQFNGKPLLVKRENEVLPAIEPDANLKSPIRMRLMARPESDCSY